MAYADTTELARILSIRDPTEAQEAAMSRVLEAAALEIDKEIGRSLDLSDDAQELALVAHVNLERAQDLWEFEQVPVGIMGLGGETPLITPRNSWERHAHVLAAIKSEWGLA